MENKIKGKIKVRRWVKEDIPGIVIVQKAAYPNFDNDDLCDERIYNMQYTAFPEGQILAELNGKIVGYATSLIVQLDDDSPWYSYSEITGVGTFTTHNPSGDTLYGADIAVHPDFRGMRIANHLYKVRKRILKRFNLRRMVAGGRIPEYSQHSGKISPEEYVVKVERGELKDMALNAHLRAGYKVKAIHMDYLSDESSLNYATFLEMENPGFNPERRKIAAAPIKRPVRKIRVCAAQYQMRKINDWEEFERQVAFFVTTADEYHSHFLLFPELFSAQLFSLMPQEIDTLEAVRRLAGYESQYVDMFTKMATKSGIHIIAGSHPILRNNQLYNSAHLFTPTGEVYIQDKIHITPGERLHWGIQPGHGLKVFDTGLARIAIQVCYDIEFPEASRLLTLAGAEVVFVPFSTDERKSYTRVRYCSQARAVENMIYVVITGNVGNLPQVRSFLINYGQAAVLTPSDFAFPLHSIQAEAEPNTEMVVIADLDLGSLSLQREIGSVTQLRDRRSDHYEIRPLIEIERIRTR